jgi:hypothetical protein
VKDERSQPLPFLYAAQRRFCASLIFLRASADIFRLLLSVISLPYTTTLAVECGDMFCRFCGTTLPNDSTFCHSCGKSLITSDPKSQPSDSSGASGPKAPPRNIGKKTAAVVLIVLFSLWVIAVPYTQMQHPPRNLTDSIADLVEVLLLITGLIFSIKWRIKLSGFVTTSGRQAVAIFLIVFCAWGLLLVVAMSSSGFFVPGLILGVVYAVGLYACIRWLRKLRRRERDQAVPQPPSSFAAAR